jgi:hypothetical protein
MRYERKSGANEIFSNFLVYHCYQYWYDVVLSTGISLVYMGRISFWTTSVRILIWNGEQMKPTMEQLQQRLADAKDYRLTTEGRADVAEQRMVAAREAVRKIEEQIDALKPV